MTETRNTDRDRDTDRDADNDRYEDTHRDRDTDKDRGRNTNRDTDRQETGVMLYLMTPERKLFILHQCKESTEPDKGSSCVCIPESIFCF